MWYDPAMIEDLVRVDGHVIDHRWVPTGSEVLIRCVNCGGEYEELRAEPAHAPSCISQILICKECKGIFGFPRQPELDKVEA